MICKGEKKTMRRITQVKRSIRAISPVIAVLLMIAIAVVASLLAYAWVLGYIGGTTTKTGKSIEIQSTTQTVGSLQYLIVYVQNVGQGPVQLKQDGSVYVNDVLHKITHSPQGTSIAGGALIDIPEGRTIEIVTDYLRSPGEHLRIRIVTVEGTSMEIIDTGSNSRDTLVSNDRYSLNVHLVGTGSVAKSPNQATYAHGESVQLIPSTSIGWQFDSWSGDLTGNANPGNILMNSEKTVTATFTQKEYTLNIQIQGSGSVAKNPDKLTYHVGDSVNLTATPGDLNWFFAGWTGDITSTNPTATITIDQTPEITATFIDQTQTQYSLTVTANPSNGGTVELSSQAPYTNGQVVFLTPHPATGYTFTGWAGDLTGSTNPGQITITRNMVVTANFAASSASLTLSANPPYAGSIAANPTGPYHIGDVVQLTAVPNTAFTFSSWSQDLSGSTNPVSITINTNKAVTANFVPREYALDIQIIGQGTVSKTPNQTTYHLGDSVQLAANPTVGWELAGWTGDTTSSNNPTTVTIDETPTVLASFTQAKYSLTVTSNPSAGGPVELSNTGPTYYYNDQVSLTPHPVTGYHFLGWSGDLTGSIIPGIITITRNMIVTADYEADFVSLTLNVDPAGKGTINAVPNGPYRFEDTVSLTAVPIAGYTFSSWSQGLSGSINPSSITLLGDTAVTANFVQREYPLTITISPAGSGTVTKNPSQATYHLDDLVQLTATPAQGWTFAGWTQDVTGTSPTATVTIDETPQVTATFTQLTYSLTVTSNPLSGGSVSRSNPGPYTYGNIVTLTPTPATGYTFTGWSGNLIGSTSPAQITITGNMIITANFEPIDVYLTLNVNPSGAGAITPNPLGPYHYGQVVQLTAVPNAGYLFTAWSQDLIGSTNPTTITLNGNKAVTATFTLNPTQTLLSVNFDGTIWDLDWNDWGNPPWASATDQFLSGPASAKCTSSNDGPFTSDPMNTQAATSITVSFDYRLNGSISQNNFQIYASGNPGSTYNADRFTTIASLGGATTNTWIHYTTTITKQANPQYFTSTFRFGFLSNLGSNAAIWVDNIVITMNIS